MEQDLLENGIDEQNNAPQNLNSRIRTYLWPKWLTGDMKFILIARIFMSATRSLAGVIVPIYLAIIGFSAFQLGLLFMVVGIASALFTSTVGILSDRIGRKPFLIIFPILAALAAFIFAFTRNTPLLFCFAAIGTFGRGAGAGAGMVGPYQPAESALLADVVEPKHRNTLFGIVGFTSSLGSLFGGGLLAILPDALPQLSHIGSIQISVNGAYQATFLVMAGMALLASVIVIPIANPQTPRYKAQPTQQKSWKIFTLSRPTWAILQKLWITNSLNGLAVGFFGPFITYWFFRRYGAGPAMIGALFAIVNIIAMVSNLEAANLAKRWGLVRAITITRSLQAILIIPMVLAPTFWVAGIIYILRMFAQRAGLPLRQSYVMAVISSEERGTVSALSNLPSQATTAIAPTFAGLFFEHGFLALPFEIGSVLQGLNTFFFWYFFRGIQPPEEQTSSAGEKAQTQIAQ